MKQRLLSIARGAGLLPALDAIRFMRSKWASAEENSKFIEEHPGFAPPPLRWMHDMYRHTSFPLYWKTGEDTAAGIAALINRHVSTPAPRVADWGCGLARVVRHLPKQFERFGFDYNAAAIAWDTEHIKDVTFARNGVRPPLPASDEAFDALYALSVFTHLSAAGHEEWIAEIRRVLAPGGTFIGAFHMTPKPGQLLPGEQAAFDAGELVVRGGVKEGSRTYVAYHPEAYLRKRLFADFVVAQRPTPFFGQTLFVVRKPA